jgi:hypothetical protein
VFPALVIIPCLCIGLIIYALMRYSAARAQRKLEQTLPFEAVVLFDEDKDFSIDNSSFKNSEDILGLVGPTYDEELHMSVLSSRSSSAVSLPLIAPVGHTTRKQSVVLGNQTLHALQVVAEKTDGSIVPPYSPALSTVSVHDNKVLAEMELQEHQMDSLEVDNSDEEFEVSDSECASDSDSSDSFVLSEESIC